MSEERIVLCQTQNDTILVLRRLMQCGISGRAVRPPRQKTGRSCTWGVQIAARDQREAENCLSDLPIRWRWMD
ncbi:MAG: putative Se/S carrier-like protein [Butyricicoccus sp.]